MHFNVKKKKIGRTKHTYIYNTIFRGENGEISNPMSWEFTLENVACKVLRWPMKFKGVAGKVPNLASSLGTITLK